MVCAMQSGRRAGSRRLRWCGAVLLLVQAALLLGGVLHSLEEAHHSPEAGRVAVIEPACPDDCTAHDHRAHDHSTCATCRALHAPAIVASALLDAPQRLAPRPACEAEIRARSAEGGEHAPRGPPIRPTTT